MQLRDPLWITSVGASVHATHLLILWLQLLFIQALPGWFWFNFFYGLFSTTSSWSYFHAISICTCLLLYLSRSKLYILMSFKFPYEEISCLLWQRTTISLKKSPLCEKKANLNSYQRWLPLSLCVNIDLISRVFCIHVRIH